MPASDITYWLAYLKIDREEKEAAHLSSQTNAGMARERAKGFPPKGRR